MNPQDPRETGVDRKRSDKDIVPEFESGQDALDFMEKKLNGSWTDALDPKESAAYDVVEPVNLENPNDVDAAFRAMMGL